MPTFHVQNFGCRASQSDGAAIESQLTRGGLASVGDHKSAHFVILNTCTVTSTADDEVRQVVRRVHRENPEAQIVVTGCYAQRAPDELIGLPGVSLVVGNSHKERIADLLAAPFHGEVHVGDIFDTKDFLAAPVGDASGERSRPNLKIQDGCPNRCSFCIIPSVRGRSRSASVEQILAQMRDLGTRYPEIVLTGIHLGRWGRDSGLGLRLPDLLRIVLSETDVKRVRLSSVEPMDWSEDLLRLMADSPRIARHIHAPLQSGSDTVLKRMHRKYRSHHYESRIRLARDLMPDAAIGADVMVGFPGETEKEFEETRAFIERMPFTYLHIFPYSERPGTPAAGYPNQIPWARRKERGRILQGLGQKKNLEFRARMIGQVLSVVTLSTGEAISSNYVNVELSVSRPAREIVDVRAGDLTAHGVREISALKVIR